jgi:hypothetical protein
MTWSDAVEPHRLTGGLVSLILILAACTGESESTTTTILDVTTISTPETTEPSPTTTVAPVTTTATTPDTTTTTAQATTVQLPQFPPERTDLEHGGDAWVVVLAASEDPAGSDLETAIVIAGEAGYTTGATDCDFGAATALGLPEDRRHFFTVSVYLRSESDAIAALDAFRARGVDGAVALVQTYCMD